MCIPVLCGCQWQLLTQVVQEVVGIPKSFLDGITALHQLHQSVLYNTFMKRATVTLPDDLAKAVENYIQAQDAAPPLTAIVQAALRQYLAQRGYLRAAGPLSITPAKRGSGRRDVSQAHDRYLASR